jgi:glycosyltransferase involved in cell wall biosynthesis
MEPIVITNSKTTAQQTRTISRGLVSRPKRQFHIDVICALPITMQGPSYTLVKLLTAMAAENLSFRLHACSAHVPLPEVPFEIDTLDLSRLGKSNLLLDKVCGNAFQRRAERRLLARVTSNNPPDAVFTFGEVSLELSLKLHQLGIFVVREKFACGKQLSRKIMEDLYATLNEPHASDLTPEMVQKENTEIKLADAVFSPSPMVRKSLVDIGFDSRKFIDTSYGWEPSRLNGDSQRVPKGDGINLLYVGYITPSKGVHILLEAWENADIKGKLILAGRMDPFIQQRYQDILDRSDVILLPYTKDIGAVFRSADWFVFPSFAEGGPQATYEAMALGVPAITSRMGAGAILRDGIDGIVIDSHSASAWAEVISMLPSREEDRARFAKIAKEHAQEFTWDRVGALRRERLIERLSDQPFAVTHQAGR